MSKDTNTSAAGREGGTRRAGETFLKREREREMGVGARYISIRASVSWYK